MGQYTATSYASSAVISYAGLIPELTTIASAHNKHSASDISSATVSTAALITDKSYFSMVIASGATLTGTYTYSDVRATCVVPMACRLVGGYFFNLVKSSSEHKVYVYKEGDSDQMAFVPLVVENQTPQTLGAPLVLDLAAGDVLSMRYTMTTTADTSSYNVLTLLAKATHD